jgi:hypothetical protein
MARPRITESYTGSLVGAVVGGLLGGPFGAAAVGAGLGALGGTAANPTKPMPLQVAVAAYVAGKGLIVGGMERRAWNQIRVVFGVESNFFYVDAAVAPKKSLYKNIEVLEDALYDVAVRRIDERVGQLGVG